MKHTPIPTVDGLYYFIKHDDYHALEARVAELEETCLYLIEYAKACEYILDAVPDVKLQLATELINRTPTQSLATVKAQALREYVNERIAAAGLDTPDRKWVASQYSVRVADILKRAEELEANNA